MPLTCAAGASASSSAITAPQPAATTTPVSSSRVGAHAARSVSARAIANTMSVDSKRACERCRSREPARCPDHQRAERADRRAAGDAEHIGIGERIAQQHLHQRARDREQSADGERGECARQPQIADDGGAFGLRVAGQRCRDVAQTRR